LREPIFSFGEWPTARLQESWLFVPIATHQNTLVRYKGGRKPRINRKLFLHPLPKFRVNNAKPLAPAYAQVIGRGMERSAVMKCPPGAASNAVQA
jgi:hypothetical protein